MRQGTGHGESLGQDESFGRDGHRTSTVERGAFSHARCSCGWVGPARRARETSRADAMQHSSQQDGSQADGVRDNGVTDDGFRPDEGGDGAAAEGVRGSAEFG